MRVVVVSGTGFIGSHVVRQLAASGDEVIVVHRGQQECELPDRARHIHTTLERMPAMAGLDCDVAILMRAMTKADGDTLVETFRNRAARLIAVSSGDVYRNYGVLRRIENGAPDPVPLREDAPLRTRLHPYDTWPEYEKILVERAVLEASGGNCVLRLPATWGPGDPYHRVGEWLRRMGSHETPFLLGRQHGMWRWTHGYVENVAAGIVLAAANRNSAGRVFNVGELATPPMLERIQRLADAFEWRGNIETVPDHELPDPLKQPYDFSADLSMDTGRIRNELGYCESVCESDAVEAAISWETSSGYAQRPS